MLCDDMDVDVGRLLQKVLNRPIVQVLSEAADGSPAEDDVRDALLAHEVRGGVGDALSLDRKYLCVEIAREARIRGKRTRSSSVRSSPVSTWSTNSSPPTPSATRAPRAISSCDELSALMQTATRSRTAQLASMRFASIYAVRVRSTALVTCCKASSRSG